LTSNLAFPGTGSLVAGFRSGYVQVSLAGIGFILTSVFGIRFVIWSLANWNRMHGGDSEPIEALAEMWRALRATLVGMALFLMGWLWALTTSLEIVRSATDQENENLPPRL
jgi:hypothetical protein